MEASHGGGESTDSRSRIRWASNALATTGEDPVALLIDFIRRDQELVAAPRGPPAPAPVAQVDPKDLAAARRYIASIAGGSKLEASQNEALFEQWLEEARIAPRSERARLTRAALFPGSAAARTLTLDGVAEDLLPRGQELLRFSREWEASPGATPAELSAAIESYLQESGMTLREFAQLRPKSFSAQTARAFNRARMTALVESYPTTAQGRLMRSLKDDALTPSGTSIEEEYRAGAFVYVKFSGRAVLRATTGRLPDIGMAGGAAPRADRPDVVFYLTFDKGRWNINITRQNVAMGRNDEALHEDLKSWLTSSGIPAGDFAPYRR